MQVQHFLYISLLLNNACFVGSGDPNIHQGLTLVALSRTKRLKDMLLEPFTEERLTNIGKTPSFALRRKQIEIIIPKLALQTLQKYQSIWNSIKPPKIQPPKCLKVLKPSLINAKTVIIPNYASQSETHYLQPSPTWIKLEHLHFYQNSIKKIKSINNDEALVQWKLIPTEMNSTTPPPFKRRRLYVITSFSFIYDICHILLLYRLPILPEI